MPGAPQSEPSMPPDRPDLTVLGESELDAALQLLVERAQYITGATGTALALPQGSEMVCRASSGACAPAVGARLQVRSGLTGESIARRQLLRCDNAETDPRVNLETCHALGIASIVVLPLLRRTGEVRGLFELFSDHPYAFEERDLVALERMAALTLTALDLAEQRQDSVTPAPQITRQAVSATVSVPAVVPSPKKEISNPQPSASDSAPSESLANAEPALALSQAPVQAKNPIEVPGPFPPLPEVASAPAKGESQPTAAEATQPNPNLPVAAAVGISLQVAEPPPPEPPAAIPEAMRRVQKCSSCGFPVSEGRTLCLDCETLDRLKLESAKKEREKAASEALAAATNPDVEKTATTKGEAEPAGALAKTTAETSQSAVGPDAPEDGKEDQPSSALAHDEILPPFLTNPQLTEESWLARHVNLLAFLVLVAAVLVAALVFFR